MVVNNNAFSIPTQSIKINIIVVIHVYNLSIFHTSYVCISLVTLKPYILLQFHEKQLFKYQMK